MSSNTLYKNGSKIFFANFVVFSFLFSILGCTKEPLNQEDQERTNNLRNIPNTTSNTSPGSNKYRVREPNINEAIRNNISTKILSSPMNSPKIEENSAASSEEVRGTTYPDVNTKNYLIEKLLNSGWQRVARNFARQNSCSDPKLNLQLGISLGDPEFFWNSKPKDFTNTSFWNQNLPRLIENEGKWRILKGWPHEPPTLERLMFLLTYLIFRPCQESLQSFLVALGDSVPSFCRHQFIATIYIFEPIFPYHLFTIIITPDISSETRIKFMRISTFLSLGFSWKILKKTLSGDSSQFQDTFITWSLISGDVETVLRLLEKPEESAVNQQIKDYLLSMEPDDFDKRYGTNKTFKRMRYHALSSVENFIEQEYKIKHKSEKQTKLDISSLSHELPPHISHYLMMNEDGTHLHMEDNLIIPSIGALIGSEPHSATHNWQSDNNPLNPPFLGGNTTPTHPLIKENALFSWEQRPAQMFPFINVNGNSSKARELK